ncbi:EthD domain-containing protein [Haliea sp. E17]|uniref:EthD domain-containing protein n=1 Tax=Haliea sp. E17 TaxID=3401576 RepID=UPI003AADA895
MYKVLHFIKRKSHLTHEQFRDHFEHSHAAMAIKFCGHLFTSYQRNYFTQVYTGGDSREPNSGYGPREWEWDLISEWILPDEASLEEIYRIMLQPEIDALFRADEDRIIDRAATVTIPCEVRDTGTVFEPKGTVFDTPSGEPSWD